MFDMTADEKREELESLHGTDVYDWGDDEVHEEYDQLRVDGMSLVESDFSNIDEVDAEFDHKYKDWN
jgi:hypothetical protein